MTLAATAGFAPTRKARPTRWLGVCLRRDLNVGVCADERGYAWPMADVDRDFVKLFDFPGPDGLAVVRVSATLASGLCERLSAALDRLVSEHAVVGVDVRALPALGSGLAAALTSAMSRARLRGRRVAVVGATPHIERELAAGMSSPIRSANTNSPE